MKRADAAARTRRRILQAAAELFTENGYGQTTLQAIANRAGVSVESVGLAGPKRRLVFAAFRMAFAGHGEAFPLAGEPAYVDMAARMPPTQVVEEYAALLAAAIARTDGLWHALHVAADVDPRAAQMLDEVRAERRREFERSAQMLIDLGLAPAGRVEVLVREFYAFASHEAFAVLHSECGVTAEQFGERLRYQLLRLLADLR